MTGVGTRTRCSTDSRESLSPWRSWTRARRASSLSSPGRSVASSCSRCVPKPAGTRAVLPQLTAKPGVHPWIASTRSPQSVLLALRGIASMTSWRAFSSAAAALVDTGLVLGLITEASTCGGNRHQRFLQWQKQTEHAVKHAPTIEAQFDSASPSGEQSVPRASCHGVLVHARSGGARPQQKVARRRPVASRQAEHIVEVLVRSVVFE